CPFRAFDHTAPLPRAVPKGRMPAQGYIVPPLRGEITRGLWPSLPVLFARAGAEPAGLGQVGPGPVVLAQRLVRLRPVAVGGAALRVEADRLGQVAHRRVGLALLQPGKAALAVGRAALRVDLERPGAVADRLLELALLVVNPGPPGQRLHV